MEGQQRQPVADRPPADMCTPALQLSLDILIEGLMNGSNIELSVKLIKDWGRAGKPRYLLIFQPNVSMINYCIPNELFWPVIALSI